MQSSFPVEMRAPLSGQTRCKAFKPAIAQLVEHLTVEIADIRWSLARFRVAGFSSFYVISGKICCARCCLQCGQSRHPHSSVAGWQSKEANVPLAQWLERWSYEP